MKNIIECPREEKKLRVFLLTLLNSYIECRENMEIPLDEEELEETLQNVDIKFWEWDKKTTGTFNVNSKEFNVIKSNFDNNKSSKNIFLLLHELTHLSSPLNKEIFDSTSSMKAEYKEMLSGKNNKDMSDFDVLMGAIAVDEVLAQWCCEESYDFIKGKTRERKTITQNIMGEYITVKTDFSDNDIYSPLQQYVEDLGNNLGFENFKSFAKCILTGEKRLNDMITPDTVEQLGYIGILCEGIYQDNGFQNFELPASDIPIAISNLDKLRSKKNLSDGPNINLK